MPDANPAGLPGQLSEVLLSKANGPGSRPPSSPRSRLAQGGWTAHRVARPTPAHGDGPLSRSTGV